MKEDISNYGNTTTYISTEDYIRLLSYIGKTVYNLRNSTIEIILKPKYKYTYNVGGFMVMHKDTIKGPTHIGTYVKVIQRAEEGGDLVSGDEYLEEPIMGDSYEYQIIPINIDHEVTIVKEGTRITEVYEIHIKDNTSIHDIQKDLITNTMINDGITKLNDMLSTTQYHDEFKNKYKNYSYIVFGSDLDPFEYARLKMFMNVFNVNTFVTTIVTKINNTYIYMDSSCYFLGGNTKHVHKKNEYNDEGYTYYYYEIANVLTIN